MCHQSRCYAPIMVEAFPLRILETSLCWPMCRPRRRVQRKARGLSVLRHAGVLLRRAQVIDGNSYRIGGSQHNLRCNWGYPTRSSLVAVLASRTGCHRNCGRIVSSVCRTRCVNRPGRSKRRRSPVPFEGFGSNPKDDRSALEIYCASCIRMGETKENEERGA